MNPKSLSHLSKEIIQKNLRNSELEKMLKKDLPTEDYNRLKENTLLTVIRECLEKNTFLVSIFSKKARSLMIC